MTGTPVWSEEQIARIRMLWDAGMTTRLIALDIGVTKNAIVGVARRRGFTPRPSPIHRLGQERPPRPPGQPTGNVPDEPRAPRTPKQPPTRPLAIAFAAGQSRCQWPTGDERPFVWCDAPRLSGGPYCREHYELAYVATRGAARA